MSSSGTTVSSNDNNSSSSSNTGSSSSSSSVHRRRRHRIVSVTVAGCFVPLAIVMVLMQLRSESSVIHQIRTVMDTGSSMLSSSLSIVSQHDEILTIDDTVPNLIECLDQCFYYGGPKPGCYLSNGSALRGENRWAHEARQVMDPASLQSLTLPAMMMMKEEDAANKTDANVTTVIDTSDAVVVMRIHTPLRNINHIFHDDFWSVLSYFSQPTTLLSTTNGNTSTEQQMKKNTSVAFIHDYTSPWFTSLLEIIVQAYPWWIVLPPLPSYHDRWICTSLPSPQQRLYINGYIRDMQYYQLPELKRIRNDLRSVAWQRVTERQLWESWWDDRNHTNNNNTDDDLEWIVIYTREDTSTRQIHDTEAILAALDTDRYAVHVQRQMPDTLEGQVALFARADLLIAPNGGWTPNVLWMKDTACLVEIHLYDTNSWLVKHGLSSLFVPGTIQVVTGDYHNSTMYGPRVQYPNRHGGDDEIQGSMVISDIVRHLTSSPDCQRFLKQPP